jgi:hypothetical protein
MVRQENNVGDELLLQTFCEDFDTIDMKALRTSATNTLISSRRLVRCSNFCRIWRKKTIACLVRGRRQPSSASC